MIYRARYVIISPDRVIANAGVQVDGGAVTAIHEPGQPCPPGEPQIDLGNCCLLPGFVNAHAHLEPTFRRNHADGLNLWEWIARLGFRRDKAPSREALAASAAVGAAECVLSGITCVGDSTWSGASAEAMARIGLRGIAYREIFGQGMADEYRARIQVLLRELEQIGETLPATVRPGLSPHSVYSSGPEMLQFVVKSCAELNIPLAMHAAETVAETDYLLSGTGPLADMRRSMGFEPMAAGMRPVRLLDECGLLRKGVCLAHCVHVDESEIALIGRSGVSVAHCPRSNGFLGAGIAPVPALLAAGATIGLGTDSAASCMRLDMFEEMRAALMLHRAVAQEAATITAKQVFALATMGGATALGLEDVVGTLDPGKRADLVGIDFSEVSDDEDIFLAILSRSPADVRMVAVDGEEVVRGGALARADVRQLRGELDEIGSRDKDRTR